MQQPVQHFQPPMAQYAQAPAYGAQAPMYRQPAQYSGAPQPVQYRAAQVKQVQQPAPAPAPAEEKITVTIMGREGVNDVINNTYTSCGEHGGRYCFYGPTNGEDMAQEWRIWTGDLWENDAKIMAQIQ